MEGGRQPRRGSEQPRLDASRSPCHTHSKLETGRLGRLVPPGAVLTLSKPARRCLPHALPRRPPAPAPCRARGQPPFTCAPRRHACWKQTYACHPLLDRPVSVTETPRSYNSSVPASVCTWRPRWPPSPPSRLPSHRPPPRALACPPSDRRGRSAVRPMPGTRAPGPWAAHASRSLLLCVPFQRGGPARTPVRTPLGRPAPGRRAARTNFRPERAQPGRSPGRSPAGLRPRSGFGSARAAGTLEGLARTPEPRPRRLRRRHAGPGSQDLSYLVAGRRPPAASRQSALAATPTSEHRLSLVPAHQRLLPVAELPVPSSRRGPPTDTASRQSGTPPRPPPRRVPAKLRAPLRPPPLPASLPPASSARRPAHLRLPPVRERPTCGRVPGFPGYARLRVPRSLPEVSPRRAGPGTGVLNRGGTLRAEVSDANADGLWPDPRTGVSLILQPAAPRTVVGVWGARAVAPVQGRPAALRPPRGPAATAPPRRGAACEG